MSRVAIQSISEIKSKNHGGPIIRLDGEYVDEFKEIQKMKVFIDPSHDNFEQWYESLMLIAQMKGHVVELDNCRFKNRAVGLVNGDSKPQIANVYLKGTN